MAIPALGRAALGRAGLGRAGLERAGLERAGLERARAAVWGVGGAGAGGQASGGYAGRRNFPEGGAGGNSPCFNGSMCAGSGGGPCTASVPFCTQCVTSKDCPIEAANCDVNRGRCYQCRRNTDCAPNQACNTLAQLCARPCKSDEDCNGDDSHRVCNTDFDVCVGCMAQPQCSIYNNGNNNPLERCYFSSCVECFEDSQCPNSQNCVAGRCQKPH